MGMTVPEIIKASVGGVCQEIKADPSVVDVGSVGATCTYTLNQQGLLAGLMATIPGLAGKPIESVENACASGGQAILSVIYKLLLGQGEVGLAVGFEKMRDNEGKMDGKLIGQALGVFSHPDERPGKTYIFPHIFAEVMADYMKTHGVTERDLAHVSSIEYGNANSNPYAQMRKIKVTLDDCANLGERNKYIIEGLPLKTYDCSQITDGYAARDRGDRGRPEAAGRGEGRRGADRRVRAGHRQPAARRPRRAESRGRADGHVEGVRDGGPHAAGRERRRAARLLHGDGRDRDGGHRQGRRTARARSTGWTARRASAANAASTPRAASSRRATLSARRASRCSAGRRGSCSAKCRPPCR